MAAAAAAVAAATIPCLCSVELLYFTCRHSPHRSFTTRAQARGLEHAVTSSTMHSGTATSMLPVVPLPTCQGPAWEPGTSLGLLMSQRQPCYKLLSNTRAAGSSKRSAMWMR